jgi:hypothetical protein
MAEEKHEKKSSQDSWCPGRDSVLVRLRKNTKKSSQDSWCPSRDSVLVRLRKNTKKKALRTVGVHVEIQYLWG